jgi:hypothetical protein
MHADLKLDKKLHTSSAEVQTQAHLHSPEEVAVQLPRGE